MGKRKSCPGRRGVVAVAMVVMLLILSVIVISFTVSASHEHDLTIQRLAAVESIYSTEAGINMAFRELTLQKDEDGDGAIGTISDDGNDGTDPVLGNAQFVVTAAVAVQRTLITSVGRSNVTRRTATLLADGNVSESAPWWNGSWLRRRKLPIDNASQAETFADFPILVALNSDRIDYADTQDAGEDIRFIDSDGLTELKYEIETWDETGTSYVWVKVPQIDGASNKDHIWLYYDNIGAADNQDAASVWTNGYSGVWHLNDNPGGAPAWLYRKKITIDSTKVTATLTDFPVLVSITDADISAAARADGFDIYFTDDDGSTKLDHELERWDNGTGELIAWVKVPSLPNAVDKDLYVYYGNSGAADQQNAPGVWSNGYVGVWHLREDPGPGGSGDMKDSRAVHDATAESDMTTSDQVAGQIGYGVDFDGSDDEVEAGDTAALSVTGALTVSAWVNPTDLSTGGTYPNAGIVSKYLGAGNERSYALFVDEEDDWAKFIVNSTGTTSGNTKVESIATLSVSTWYYLTGVYEPSSSLRIYIDGTVDNTNSTSIPASIYDSTADMWIGRQYSSQTKKHFNGIIDEARISNTARSADWILTEYNNQFDPATFLSVGAEEANGAPSASTDSTAAGNDGVLGGSMDAADQVPGQVGGSLDYEGTDDFVGIAGFNATLLPATLTAWVNADVSMACSGVVFSRGTAVSGMNVGGCSNAFALGYTWNDAANTSTWAGGPSLPVNEWSLAVLVVEAAQATAYVYGPSGSAAAVNAVAHASSLIDDLKIAQDDLGGRFFDGRIDEVRVSSVARSSDWNRAQYKSMADDFILWALPVLAWQESEP